MTRKKFFVFIFLLFFFQGNHSLAEKIVYMDSNYIVNNSIIGKKVLDELNILNKKNLDNLKINQNMLKKEKEEINKIKNVASNEDLKKKVMLHNQNVKKFDKLKKRLSDEINKKRNEEMKKLVELIDPLLQDYMKNNSIDMILNKEIVYIAKDEYDISKAIIELTNNKYK